MALKMHSYMSILWTFLVPLLTSAQIFNSRCSQNTNCDSSRFLHCLNNYCQCDSRTQIYDHTLQQCVLRPGTNCYFKGSVTMKCARNSVCVNSICQCQPGYGVREGGEVLCKPECKDCDGSKGLECVNNSCQCRNSSLSYQGMFGCVDPRDPEYLKMMATLKQTEELLKNNNLNLDNLVQDLNDRQLFTGGNLIDFDLVPSAQNQAGGLLSSFGSLLGRQGQQAYGPPSSQQQGGYGGGGGSSGGQQGGYGGSTVPIPTGRGAFNLITSFLNSFNQLIPSIQRLAGLLNPFRLIQRLLMNFRIPNLNLRGPTGGYASGGNQQPSSGYGPPGSNRPTNSYGPPGVSQPIQSFTQINSPQQNQQSALHPTFSNYPGQFQSIATFQQAPPPQSSPSRSNNNQVNNNNDLDNSGGPPVIALPSSETNSNFPRQERQFGNLRDSPYLPEHL